MVDHLILLAPSANRVYASEANRLVAAELKIMLGANDQPAIEPITLAGIGYLALATENLDERTCQALGRLSGCYATFCRQHGRLQPIEMKKPDLFDDDLVTIPKYPGKTNEQFTRLLINVTLASMTRDMLAVLTARHIAQEVDFLSIGTNDLTQYLLASDRGSHAMANYYEPLHPAVMLSIKAVVDAAARSFCRSAISPSR